MRRLLITLLMFIVGSLAIVSTAGCEESVVTSSARSSLAGFLNGIFTRTINGAIVE